MNKSNVADVRRENLSSLIAERFDGNNAAFCRASGKHQNMINLILTKNLAQRRNMGERLARDIERQIGLVEGFLDVPRQDQTAGVQVYTIPITRLDAASAGGLERVVIGADVIMRHLASPSGITNIKGCYMPSDEMSPLIKRDDLMFIDTAVEEFDRDGVYVVARGKDLFVRRVRRVLTGGVRIFADTDPSGSIEASANKFKSAGRVVGVMSFVQP
jgi:hypothetical protein